MKSLKVLLGMLVLALALTGCRSVPGEVLASHNMSVVASRFAFEIAEDTLVRLEEKSITLGVADEFLQWTEHLNLIMTYRGTVQKYLVDTKADTDVVGPYSIGHKLLVDMHGGFWMVNAHWKDMLREENDEARTRFIELFRKDIERFKVLERKFNEWISQFRVKG